MIIDGEEGFDMRFANIQGRYGAGNYYACNASYSCPTYCSTRPDGNLSVVYASVLIGKPATSVDPSRKMPPKYDGD